MKAESIRQKKFSKLIQQELSQILQREVTIPNTPLLTVSIVRSSPDLNYCKVYLTALPDESLEHSVTFLNENIGEVRHQLAIRIRHQVRHIPELHFYPDDTAQYAAHMDKLFDSIDIPEEE